MYSVSLSLVNGDEQRLEQHLHGYYAHRLNRMLSEEKAMWVVPIATHTDSAFHCADQKR